MCFSVQIDKNIKKLAERFRAVPDKKAFLNLKELQELELSIDRKDLKQRLGLKRVPSSSVFKIPGDDERTFPNYFAPVITYENNQRVIRPMRYRIRPSGSTEEIPNKFNVFNARIDSLENRKTWSPLFMRRHGLFPFKSFFEWVLNPQKMKRQINFFPEEKELMWAPCLWDSWSSHDGSIRFRSFALITDNPPYEIERMGHDRCPIFLNEAKVCSWLNPSSLSKNQTYSLLRSREPVNYTHRWVESS